MCLTKKLARNCWLFCYNTLTMAEKREKPAKKSERPSLLREKLAKKLLSDKKGKSIGKAMREVGYSKSYANNPHLVTKTKSWQDIMEEYLPDKLLAKRHKQLLNKKTYTKVSKIVDGQMVDSVKVEPETQAVSKGLDLAYKIKGRIIDKVDVGSEKLDEALDRLADLLP